MPVTKKTSKQVGLQYGFRSGLEEVIAAELDDAGVSYKYEGTPIEFVQPAKPRKYSPDFRLPDGSIIETKGRFVTADRQKHLMIKAQHPDLKIRFLFNNPNARISKQSRTTYAMWCEKHGFEYAACPTKAQLRDGAKAIPPEWI